MKSVEPFSPPMGAYPEICPRDQLHKAEFTFKDGGRPGHTVGGEQGGEHAVASRIGEGAAFPHAHFASPRLPQGPIANAGDADGVCRFRWSRLSSLQAAMAEEIAP